MALFTRSRQCYVDVRVARMHSWVLWFWGATVAQGGDGEVVIRRPSHAPLEHGWIGVVRHGRCTCIGDFAVSTHQIAIPYHMQTMPLFQRGGIPFHDLRCCSPRIRHDHRTLVWAAMFHRKVLARVTLRNICLCTRPPAFYPGRVDAFFHLPSRVLQLQENRRFRLSFRKSCAYILSGWMT